jgi:hypothetical protein
VSVHILEKSNMKKSEVFSAFIGAQKHPDGPLRDYLVTVFKKLKCGGLYALVLRVSVAQPIEWVRWHVDEIVAIGSKQDRHLETVALNIAAA